MFLINHFELNHRWLCKILKLATLFLERGLRTIINSEFKTKMVVNTPIILEILEGTNNLPTADLPSFIILSLFQISEVPIKLKYGISRRGRQLPYLEYGIFTADASNFNRLYTFARELSRLDDFLTEDQRLTLRVYKKYFDESVGYTLTCDLWVRSLSYDLTIKPYYQRAVSSHMINEYLCHTKNRIVDDFSLMRGSRATGVYMLILYDLADSCLATFEKIYKDNRQFFFGNRPCSLDACLSSAIIFALKMPTNWYLKHVIEKHTCLIAHSQMMHQDFFNHKIEHPKMFRFVKHLNNFRVKANAWPMRFFAKLLFMVLFMILFGFIVDYFLF